jgi:hypothetical protein
LKGRRRVRHQHRRVESRSTKLFYEELVTVYRFRRLLEGMCAAALAQIPVRLMDVQLASAYHNQIVDSATKALDFAKITSSD